MSFCRLASSILLFKTACVFIHSPSHCPKKAAAQEASWAAASTFRTPANGDSPVHLTASAASHRHTCGVTPYHVPSQQSWSIPDELNLGSITTLALLSNGFVPMAQMQTLAVPVKAVKSNDLESACSAGSQRSIDSVSYLGMPGRSPTGGDCEPSQGQSLCGSQKGG